MKKEKPLEQIATELNVIRDLVREHDFPHMENVHKYLCKQYIKRFDYLYKVNYFEGKEFLEWKKENQIRI